MNHCRRAQFVLAIAITLELAGRATAQSAAWTGAINTNWNTAGNWNPSVVPNSATANVSFTGSAIGLINISASVQAYSISFSNPTGNYTLTSSAGVCLGSMQSITVGPTVTGIQTINLANVTAGSLLFPIGSNLTITNNSAAAGTTLVIGPNTVIGTLGLGGIV